MDLPSLLAIAVGLAMDATAVSLASGITLARIDFRRVFRMSFHFGLFQGGMPVLGWLAGAHLLWWVRAWDHWVAFGLLAVVGGKMIYESIRPREGEKEKSDPSRGLTLVALAVATSIDALAVGMGLGVMKTPIFVPALLFGGVTTILCAMGMVFGRSLGKRFGRGMTALGGIVLLGIGVKIVLEHTL
ncbi:MAG: manganese efflux pump MntP [Planctomycetota bacterium]|jgi:putative Mn2+ efflux pump MntP